MNIQRYRQTDRGNKPQTDRHMERQTDRQTKTWTQMQIDLASDTDQQFYIKYLYCIHAIYEKYILCSLSITKLSIPFIDNRRV